MGYQQSDLCKEKLDTMNIEILQTNINLSLEFKKCLFLGEILTMHTKVKGLVLHKTTSVYPFKIVLEII